MSGFSLGDLVCVTDTDHVSSNNAVWKIVAEDTNKTPIRDPQPAYRLERWLSGRQYVRYAYASDLHPAAILASTGDSDGQAADTESSRTQSPTPGAVEEAA